MSHDLDFESVEEEEIQHIGGGISNVFVGCHNERGEPNFLPEATECIH